MLAICYRARGHMTLHVYSKSFACPMLTVTAPPQVVVSVRGADPHQNGRRFIGALPGARTTQPPGRAGEVKRTVAKLVRLTALFELNSRRKSTYD
ncbi:hypothetical protein A0H81_07505 [Grifola frondosa]|uniref:Uncharacterized protein n=1 Tax=Grifola frondosa TaxID=5627 RepID=A0A1C7M5U8_GRIFR|nr:hypothetical protein A0H81_07505 [Grifola frondosa]